MPIEWLGWTGAHGEFKLCEPCWKEHDGLGVQASWLVHGVPMCEEHRNRMCWRCRKRWSTTYGDNEFALVCDGCYTELKRLETRRKEYNQHLGSKQWWQTKKNLRKASRTEHGSVICSRCGMSEHDNKQTYGEGLHGHHQTYERFGHERDGDVELLCSRCHAWRHRLPPPKPITVGSRFSQLSKRVI